MPVSRTSRGFPRRALRQFGKSESGMVSIFAMFMFFTVMCVIGIALDYAYVMARATHLQTSSDSVAHSALYVRDVTNDPDVAKTKALETAQASLKAGWNLAAIETSDIEFGDWDYENNTFTPDPNSRQAVRVNAERTAERGNKLPTLLLRLVGLNSFDVIRPSIAATYRPICFREGLAAEGIVDIQSNNSYFNGFCLHSNTYISINSNNFFEPGTIVSMPDLNLLDAPESSEDSNTGLDEALREGTYHLRVINRLPRTINELEAGIARSTPDFITNTIPLKLTKKKIGVEDFEKGRIHTMACLGGKASMDPGTYSEIVFVSDCQLQFKSGVILEDAVIATRSTSDTSLNTPSGLQVGRDDNCADGGDATLLTLGGVSVPADLRIYGSRIIAKGSIEFAANADGIQGASMVSGGEIHGTSNMDMAFCGKGMNDLYEAEYFRIVD